MGFFEWLSRVLGGAPPKWDGPVTSPKPAGFKRPERPDEEDEEERKPKRGGIAAPKPALPSNVAPPRRDVFVPMGSPAKTASTPAAKPRESTPLNLDLGQFAPLSRDEIVRRAQATGRPSWMNPWFGRRDIIPPATDPRTNTIDRAMVGIGLITPEALVEIHKIGEEMAELRPDLARASHQADEAVRRDAEDRVALRARKKAEAAERKKKHLAEVAQRKATDITFLGRGVSKGLNDRRANVEKLQKNNLPLLAHPVDVAKALGLPIPRLRWLAFHSDASGVSHYVRFTIPKKSGGTRELAAPHRDLARCQKWILENILNKLPLNAAAHGFAKGHSTLTNAQPHVGRDAVVNCDLKDFFPTITFPRVRGIFQTLGYSPAAATILALLCTESPRKKAVYDNTTYWVAIGPRALPQGACTSPALSNLIAAGLDKQLTQDAARHGWTYTRYADDITFSASGEAVKKTGLVLARIRHVAEHQGFAVNEKKTRVQRQSMRQTVTGIVVNKHPAIPRDTVRRVRAILHHAKKEGLAAQNREKIPNFEAWISGMIAYIAMVNPKQGAAFKAQLDALRNGPAA